MSSTVLLTIIIISVYLLISVIISAGVARKYKMTTLADIFTASKSLGVLALCMAVFGAQITAFSILGGPGLAYNLGYPTLGYVMGPVIAAPVAFFVIGYRVWVLSRKYNYLTPVQFFESRFASGIPKYVMAVLQLILLVPYVLICGIGAGTILSVMTDGLVPYSAGAFIILLICSWTAYSGGMRGTAYTNIFQGILIFVVMFLMLFYTFKGIGGAEIIAGINEKMISLGGQGLQNPKMWIPYSLLATGLSNGVYAHILIRNMSADSPRTIKRNMILYPFLLGIFWSIAVLLGVWGSIAVPGLQGAATEDIVPLLAQKYAPAWMIGLLGAGILATVMTTLDALVLTMSSMFSEDLYKPLVYSRRTAEMTDKKQKNISQMFIIIISVIVYILTLIKPASILSIGTFSFAGTASLVPAYIACLYWKRATKEAVITSALIGTVSSALWAFEILPASSTLGFFYGFPAFVLAAAAAVIVSLLSGKKDKSAENEFFSAFKDTYSS